MRARLPPTTWRFDGRGRAARDDVPRRAGHASLELEPIAGHDLPAELGVVHAASQAAAAPSRDACRENSRLAPCVSASIMSTPA
jgi:hypothetical protein